MSVSRPLAAGSPARHRPRPGRGRALRLAALLLAPVALVAAGCGDGGAALGGRLADLVAGGRYAVGAAAATGTPAALQFAARPEIARVERGGESRQAVVTAPGRWWWSGTVPPGARLSGAATRLGDAAGPLEVTITALLPFERQRVLAAGGAGGWLPLGADLGHLAGQHVRLEVEAIAAGGTPARVAWAPFEISGARSGPQRPNIVFVLVDTLRADRLPVYGARRLTSPNLDAFLVSRGVVVERAYAQAPWTLPSLAGLFASRWPGEIVERGPTPVPPEAPVLPEVLQRLGYETVGFFGNPVLHAGTGFHRGFDVTYCSDDPLHAMQHEHADHLTRLARRWLGGRSQRPFFLYAHYVDPHDPYANADTAGNRSAFYPDYPGDVAGDWVHGIYLGKMPLRRPAEDIRHLRALYDSEIRFFDRYLGGLVAALDPATRANTLFVLTADHGEELFDHRGWKHGRTLYEEQLRVPLVFRWDDRLPAGSRIRGPVRLLDLAPTLVAAAGGTPPATWQGRDLLPALRGGADRRDPQPLYARHLADGPVRAAALAGRWKLILFDRNAPHVPADEHQAILYRQELARLQRVELYDLQADPGERSNQAAARPDVVRQLAPVVHEHLGREVPGLRVLLAGAAPGQRVEVSLRFARAPTGWQSYFLGPTDRVSVDGDRLRLALFGEALEKGVLVPAEAGAVLDVAVRSDTPVGVRLGGGASAASGAPAAGAIPEAALRRGGWPRGDGAAVLLWLPQPAGRLVGRDEIDPETRRRLEALGYTG